MIVDAKRVNKPGTVDKGADQVNFIRLAGDRVLDPGERVEHALRICEVHIVVFENQDGSRTGLLPPRLKLGALGFAQAVLAGFL